MLGEPPDLTRGGEMSLHLPSPPQVLQSALLNEIADMAEETWAFQ